MAGSVCSYRSCTNSRCKVKGIRMFRFPKTNTQVWVQNSGNSDLIGISPTKLYNTKRVCESHFKKEDISASGRLITGTVPIPYVPTSAVASPKPSTSNLHSSKSPNLRVKRTLTSPRRYLGKLPTDIGASPAVSTTSAIFSVEKASPSVACWVQSSSPTSQKTDKAQTARRALFRSPTKTTLASKIKMQSSKLAAKRATISRMKRQILKTKCITQSKRKTNIGLSFKTKDAATLFNMQAHKARSPWNISEKTYATKLYLRSPAAYKYLSKSLKLPGVSTVLGWLSTKKLFQTGFTKDLLSKIKLKVDSMTKLEKACVVMFDGMAIKQCLEYSPQYDCIEGFQDIGCFGRDPSMGKEASVFMVRGLFYQWKLPIGYFITDKGLSGDQIKTFILECVDKLSGTGLLVKAIVCDQCPPNTKAFKDLGASEEKPYFFKENGEKVFTCFDTPHLLKSLRNNLLTHDFVYDNKVVSFSDIKQLFNIESLSTSTRAAHQLTPAHIWPNNFQKMSVSLAAQIFSHTTAAAIKTAVATKQLKSGTALDTANFISEINSTFDAMNSRRLYSPNPDSCALSKDNSHIVNILKTSLILFKGLRKLNAKHPRPPCFNGFTITISAILQLLESEGCKFLLTSRLNQDPLENFFSSVRQRGGWNRNPTVKVFRSTFRIFTLRYIIDPPKSTSYDPDLDEVLEVPQIRTEPGPHFHQGAPEEEESESSQSSTSVECDGTQEISTIFQGTDVVTLEQCSQVYFAGYIAHKYNTKFKCGECLTRLCDKDSNLTRRNELLLLNRTFTNINIDEHSGLKAPSENLLHVVNTAIKVFRNMFWKKAHKLNIVKRLLRITESVVSIDSLTCLQCNDSYRRNYILHTFFKVLIHKQCKWVSDTYKQRAIQKLKVLHHV